MHTTAVDFADNRVPAEYECDEEERVRRVARAMCRAARLDPDAQVPTPAYTMMIQDPGTYSRPQNWMTFRLRAEKLIAEDREAAAAL